MVPQPANSTLFPYTTLFRSRLDFDGMIDELVDCGRQLAPMVCDTAAFLDGAIRGGKNVLFEGADRKSTRLNSSHPSISYAVSCLKKKKTNTFTKRKRSTTNQ